MSRDNLGRPKFGLLEGFVTDYDTCKTQFADWRIPASGMSSGLIDDSANKPSTILWSSSNIAVTSSIQTDGSNIPGFAITVPTSGMTVKGASYNIEMKLNADAWTTNKSFEIQAPASGNPVLNVSPVIGGSTYNFRVRGVSSLGTKGEWSNVVSKAAVGDSEAPATPTRLEATGLIKSILLSWDANTEADLRHYAIYRGTSSNPRTIIAYSNTTTFIDCDVTVGTTYYYRIKAIDYSGNASGYSSNASAAATYTMADDLARAMQPYTANIKFYPTPSYPTSRVSWDSGSIAFADGTTQAINAGNSYTCIGGVSSLSAGTVYYLYFTLGSATLTLTSTYSDCVSNTRGLLCSVAVASDSSSMGIFPCNSKLPLINADMVAANAIEAIHIQADAITASKILSVGSEDTFGARIKMTQSTFRVYNYSSTTDSNYYPIEIDTNGIYGYNWTSSSKPNPNFKLTTSGTIRIEANDVLQMWYSSSQTGHIYVDASGVALVGEYGKVADLIGPGGCVIRSTNGAIAIEANSTGINFKSGFYDIAQITQNYGLTILTKLHLGNSAGTYRSIWISGGDLKYIDESGNWRTLTGS
ncbi:MAG: hypothetical protein GX584_11655 [Clostridiaceae bacterium]|nr:hypothetical protein [Clostridiaceae bacterium]